MKVLFIASAMHSGSTLLGILLDRFSGMNNLGEILWFWRDVYEREGPCGCGETLDRCPFWSKVLADVQGQGIDPARIMALTDELNRTARMPKILTRRFRPRVHRDWTELIRATRALYRSISGLIPGNVIVDGSKLPTHLMLLESAPELDIRPVHLVRDGRAVAWSWEKRRRIHAARQMQVLLDRGLAESMVVWSVQNRMLSHLIRKHHKRALIRYEDLVRTPDRLVVEICQQLGLELPNDTMSDGSEPAFYHPIAGKGYVRMKGTQQKVVPDEAWRTNLSIRTQNLLTLLAPLSLHRYDYSLFSLPAT